MELASDNYPDWAVQTYEQRIMPVILSCSDISVNTVKSDLWLNTCHPGLTSITRHRLFPGSFFLLWIEAFGADQKGSEALAAAIELLHNSTLLHDDVIDKHNLRKGQPTLLSIYGSSVALLGGDGLIATAMRILSAVPTDKLAGCLQRLGRATEEVVVGQILDEHQYWRKVPLTNYYQYWQQVCTGKLSLGNVAGSLAAYWSGNMSKENEIIALLHDFSVVSQIINDFGDWLGFAGYHTLAPSLRRVGEEALQKPTLPLIWSGRPAFSEINEQERKQLVQKAKNEIQCRKEKAIMRLHNLGIQNSKNINLIRNFFTSPDLPQLE